MSMVHKSFQRISRSLEVISLFFFFGFCGMLIDLDHIFDCSSLTWSCMASGRTLKSWHHLPGSVTWLLVCLGLGLGLFLGINLIIRWRIRVVRPRFFPAPQTLLAAFDIINLPRVVTGAQNSKISASIDHQHFIE